MRGARGDSRSGRQHRPAAVLGVSEPGSGGSRTWRVEGTREEAVAVGSGWSQSEPGSPSQGSGCGDGGLMSGGVGGLWSVSEETKSGGASLKRRAHRLLPRTLRSQQSLGRDALAIR